MEWKSGLGWSGRAASVPRSPSRASTVKIAQSAALEFHGE
jgi:hypothetical protein